MSSRAVATSPSSQVSSGSPSSYRGVDESKVLGKFEVEQHHLESKRETRSVIRISDEMTVTEALIPLFQYVEQQYKAHQSIWTADKVKAVAQQAIYENDGMIETFKGRVKVEGDRDLEEKDLDFRVGLDTDRKWIDVTRFDALFTSTTALGLIEAHFEKLGSKRHGAMPQSLVANYPISKGKFEAAKQIEERIKCEGHIRIAEESIIRHASDEGLLDPYRWEGITV